MPNPQTERPAPGLEATDGYALVTGAGGGLGSALARRLAARRPVVLAGRNAARLAVVAAESPAGRALPVVCDVSDADAVAAAFDAGRRWAGSGPGLVICCAGSGAFGPVERTTPQEVRETLSGGLLGTIFVAQRAFAEMKAAGGGTICAVLSTDALTVRPGEAVYCAAKWGARGFIEALRAEAWGTGVSVVAVYPGGMRTPFWNDGNAAGKDTSAFMDPDEVAETVVEALTERRTLSVLDLHLNRRRPAS
jgi:uncharacterized protein